MASRSATTRSVDSHPSADDDAVAALVADVFARACPSRVTLEHVAGKWGMLALAALLDGNYRFNALRRRVDGISEKMLAQTLQALERDGMVVRDVQATIPPRVEYSLTPLGRAVAGKLIELIELVEREMPAVLAARVRFDTTT
jgi:DNA-binding HxlR family transcriptional regulator